MGFPEKFLWGTATAAYQIEGASGEEFKGSSIWDTFVRLPNKIKDGGTGDVACDHYHRYIEDVSLMKAMGVNAYRFSISWSRILPEGTGAVNTKGLDFYDRLTDELLAQQIQPCATLFHWDFPQALYEKGGWMNRDASRWFAEYTEQVVKRLGDRIACWMTFNEMMVVVDIAHRLGAHAPGEKLEAGPALTVLKNILLSHGRGVQVLRTSLPSSAQIGVAHTGLFYTPATDSKADLQAVRAALFDGLAPSGMGTGFHSMYLDPMLLGTTPEWGPGYFGNDWLPYTDQESAVIAQPLDFLGINCYWGLPVCASAGGKPELAPFTPEKKTHFDWPVTPDSLYWAIKLFHERYKLPIMITENGMSNNDVISADGCVHDKARIDFLQEYLRKVRQAANEGIPLLGYMHWSLMDNFEWAAGYAQRFGLVYVDYQTQKRTLKDSALWYRRVILSNGEDL